MRKILFSLMSGALIVAGMSSERASGADTSTVKTQKRCTTSTTSLGGPLSCRNKTDNSSPAPTESLGGTVRRSGGCGTSSQSSGGCGTSQSSSRINGTRVVKRSYYYYTPTRSRDRRNDRDRDIERDTERERSAERERRNERERSTERERRNSTAEDSRMMSASAASSTLMADLAALHDLQLAMMKSSGRISRTEQKELAQQMRELSRDLYATVSKIEGFPFSDRLSDMNSVVGDLLSGKVKSDLPIRHDTTPEEMLVQIQNLQKDKLRAYLRVR